MQLYFQFFAFCVVSSWFFVLLAGITLGIRKLQASVEDSVVLASQLDSTLLQVIILTSALANNSTLFKQFQKDTLYGGGEL